MFVCVRTESYSSYLLPPLPYEKCVCREEVGKTERGAGGDVAVVSAASVEKDDEDDEGGGGGLFSFSSSCLPEALSLSLSLPFLPVLLLCPHTKHISFLLLLETASYLPPPSLHLTLSPIPNDETNPPRTRLRIFLAILPAPEIVGTLKCSSRWGPAREERDVAAPAHLRKLGPRR